MEEVDYIFFVDFDGTIATVDVCEKMVAAFAGDGWQEINEMWERKELSTLECARQTLKLFRTNDPADFFSLLNNVTIAHGFPLFLTYCRVRNFPVSSSVMVMAFILSISCGGKGLNCPTMPIPWFSVLNWT